MFGLDIEDYFLTLWQIIVVAVSSVFLGILSYFLLEFSVFESLMVFLMFLIIGTLDFGLDNIYREIKKGKPNSEIFERLNNLTDKDLEDLNLEMQEGSYVYRHTIDSIISKRKMTKILDEVEAKNE